MNRVKVLTNHTVVPPPVTDEANKIAGPKKVEAVHDNGWGYKDTSFDMTDDGIFSLSGDRYLYSGKEFPAFYDFIKRYGVDKDVKTLPKAVCSWLPQLPVTRNENFINNLKIPISFDSRERLLASHGHTVQEIYQLRFERFDRIVDGVVYPTSHREVESVVKLAVETNTAILPCGGATTVTHSLLCDPNEKRMIVAVNVTRMNKILNINPDNMTVTLQAGCVGSHLEKQLGARGFMLGHEPDSWEFSTVGGWIATRASGMKKNIYGNIEDLLIDLKIVTPQGTLSRNTDGIPRMSSGPDILQMVMGSEGTLGVITEATLKIRPLPREKIFASLVFPDFESGTKFMREIASLRIQPASVRLMDNIQFQLGSSMKPRQSIFHKVLDRIIKFYVLNIKGFKADDICAATMTFEGNSKAEVQAHEKRLNEIAKKYNGIPGGSGNGIRGYFLTFVIAYLRDFGMRYQFMAESFETAVPWDKVSVMIQETKAQVYRDAKEAGIQYEPMISARVTQTYDSGACVYFYLGLGWKGLNDPMAVYSRIEDRARECVMKHGGSISHHHGVGKLRKRFMKSQVGEIGQLMIKSVKSAVDPTNVFANGNLV